MRLETHFDETLRERANSEDELRTAIDEERADLQTIRDQLADEDIELERTRLGRTLNRLSEHLKLAGEADEARALCDEAIAIWRDLGRERAAFLARLRRADIEMVRGELDDALPKANRLVEAAADDPFAIYRDFALELRGRIRANHGDREGALEDLESALETRRNGGRERLADQTERLLELVRG